MNRARATRRIVLLVIALVLCVIFRPDRALTVATGSAAHDLCSEVFVAHQDPDRIFAESLAPRPGFRIVAPAIFWSVDHERQTTRAALLGAFVSRAQFRDGIGCTLVFDSDPVTSASANPLRTTGSSDEQTAATPLLGALAPAGIVEPADQRLRKALDDAFVEAEHAPHHWTSAVVVMHDGKIVAERYAPGIDSATPLLGFSMTKSVTNALIGILVQKGRLSVGWAAPVPAWQASGDPRQRITIEQLLRMESGLDLDETGTGFDPSNQMLYDEPDMADFAARAALIAPPATRWHYSSASTQLLARIVRDTVGGTGVAVQQFARRELFAPLGMEHVTLEMDRTGTPIGSHYMLASARDWARLGWLYAEDGVLAGQRILPEGWARYSATPTLDTDYGAGFWTNAGQHPHALWRVEHGMPVDSFFASGNLGQRIAILPSQHLVVVRTGFDQGPDYDIAGFVRLVAACVDALGPSQHALR